MNIKVKYYFLIFFIVTSSSLFSQKVGIYSTHSFIDNSDVPFTTINDIAGFPTVQIDSCNNILDDFKSIVDYDVVFIVNCDNPFENSFTDEIFSNFLDNGGVLFADYYSTEMMESTFGQLVESEQKTDIHNELNINSTNYSSFSRWLNDPLELKLPLGESGGVSFNVFDLFASFDSPLALYEDNSIAISSKNYENGKAVFFGPSCKRLVCFPRNNRDLSAQRSYNNDFEPGADIIPLLIRGIIEDQMPVTVWKHTLPKDYKSALVITHDVDKVNSYENAQSFIDYEKEHHIPAHYFIGTKYINDYASAPLYNDYQGKELLNTLLDAGFTVGSNSVGGFKDFDDNDVFPLGVSSISAESYSPFNDGDATVRGTVLGELIVSKEILEQDGGRAITSFRSGSMRFNKYLPEGLQTAQYTTESSFYANDVMTGFPYFLQKGQSSSESPMDVLEIPVHISDAVDYLNKDEYSKAVDIWEEVIGKYSDNYAPVTLSIDPDKDYKLAALDMLLQRIEGQTKLLNFEELNDFWRERRNLSYQTDLNSTNKVLTITIPESILPISDNQSLHITKGKTLDSIIVVSDAGMAIDHQLIDWDEESYLLHFTSPIQDFKVENSYVACLDLEVEFSFEGTASEDFDSIRWDFGDNTSRMVYDANNTKHSYSIPGYYDVNLTIWNNGVQTHIKKEDAVFLAKAPEVSFSYAVSDTNHYAPFDVAFTNTSYVESSKSITYKWTIKDSVGQVIKEEENISYLFKTPGTYQVILELTEVGGCYGEYDEIIVIKDYFEDYKVVNDSNAYIDVELEFSFAGPILANFDSTRWDFGDDSIRVTYGENAIKHAYSTPGYYDVNLTIWHNGVETKIKKNKAVLIHKAPEVSFSYTAIDTNHYAPVEVTFTNTSIAENKDSASYKWNIQDAGTTQVQETKDALYTFTQPGTYRVQLELFTASGYYDTYEQMLLIKDDFEDYEVVNDSNAYINLELEFSFAGSKTANFDSVRWDFGDDSIRVIYDGNVIKHAYSTPGYYDVNLTIWHKGVETKIEKNKAVLIYKTPEVSFSYSAIDTNHYAPVKVTFRNTSIIEDKDSASYKWNIQDAGTTRVQETENASYTFIQPGTYRVQLELFTASGYYDTYEQVLVVRDAMQKNEINYISDSNSLCPNGFNYRLSGDTLTFFGTTSKKCCLQNTAVLVDEIDTIKILTFETNYTGEACINLCDYCFEIQILDFDRAQCEVVFEGDVYHISTTSALGEVQEALTHLTLVPNPTNDKISIKINTLGKAVLVEFYDMQGVKLSHTTDISKPLMVPIQSGVCLLKITIDGQTEVRKVVKL